VRDFVGHLLAPGGPFLSYFQPFQRLVAAHGAINSLAQTLLKAVSPGVPDFYQGTELWDLSLVDPDNRRPIDFARRRQLLDALRADVDAAGPDLTGLCRELLDRWTDGRVKLYVTHRALTLRRERARLFAAGAYAALPGGGQHAQHVVALARRDGADAVVAAVPRLTARLAGLTGVIPLGEPAWENTWIALGDDLAGVYRDRFTGLTLETERRDGAIVLAAPALFGHFPIALLEREAPRG
jgi:(1->4)-alpha-D-glucan 1-alpha-D-glucosylmutase